MPPLKLWQWYSLDLCWESPSTRLPSPLLGVMEGGRMWREEVGFLQADCWMERLRDGQMTMAGSPRPECRLRQTCTRRCVGSGCCAKCTERRLSQRIWQGDPFILPHPAPFIPASSFPLHSFSSPYWHQSGRWWVESEGEDRARGVDTTSFLVMPQHILIM